MAKQGAEKRGQQKPDAEEQKTCFIIMPITTQENYFDLYRDTEEHFRHVLDLLMMPAVEKAGYTPIRPSAQGADLIHAEIIQNLQSADLVLCDMSCVNPNVLFEFGIRTALNKPVCIVKDDKTPKVPFDTMVLNYHQYRSALDSWHLPEDIRLITSHIRDSAKRSKGDNALWRYFGLRTAATPFEGDDTSENMMGSMLNMMDSMRMQFAAALHRRDSRDQITFGSEPPEIVWRAIVAKMPPEVSVVNMSMSDEGWPRVLYEGSMSPSVRHRISREILAEHGVRIDLRPLQPRHPEWLDLPDD